jgi:hypothetical protein
MNAIFRSATRFGAGLKRPALDRQTGLIVRRLRPMRWTRVELPNQKSTRNTELKFGGRSVNKPRIV